MKRLYFVLAAFALISGGSSLTGCATERDNYDDTDPTMSTEGAFSDRQSPQITPRIPSDAADTPIAASTSP